MTDTSPGLCPLCDRRRSYRCRTTECEPKWPPVRRTMTLLLTLFATALRCGTLGHRQRILERATAATGAHRSQCVHERALFRWCDDDAAAAQQLFGPCARTDRTHNATRTRPRSHARRQALARPLFAPMLCAKQRLRLLVYKLNLPHIRTRPGWPRCRARRRHRASLINMKRFILEKY